MQSSPNRVAGEGGLTMEPLGTGSRCLHIRTHIECQSPGCSQGSSADAIRYPRGMEQNGMTRFTELHKTAARIVEFMHRFSTHL